MPRTDVKPLSYMELESFREIVSNTQPPAPEEPAGPQEAKPAPQAAMLEYCPHCHTKLSALDNKFGLCMACHKPLAENPADDKPDRAPVRIGI